MPPSSEKVVQPCLRQMSQSRDLVNLRLMTPGISMESELPSVTAWALPWVSERPV